MAPEQKATKVSEMRSLVTKYTSNFPTRPHVPSSEPTPPLSSPGPVLDTVLLVGSRGGIGANLLAQLLQSAQVGRVYALNRARTDGKTDQKRQADEFDVQGLGNSLAYSEKLVLLEGDTAHPTLGLPDSVFAKVSSSVTTIIVNGWRVEFAPPLSVFEPLVAGVRNLIDICLRSPHRRVPHLLFCSSLAVTTGITRPTPLPETFISDPTSIVGEGYRESKWVVESIIETALQQTALNATVARIGQVCGSLNGLWKTHEWFPMIVKSSQHLGCLPMDDRILTWIPADIAAAAIIDLLGTTLPLAHIAHPNPISGALIMDAISTKLSLVPVSRTEWLARLEASIPATRTKEERKKNPAVRLLPMMRGIMFEIPVSNEGKGRGLGAFNMPIVAVDNTKKASRVMREAKPLTRDDAMRWIEKWQDMDFLDKEPGSTVDLRIARL